MAFSAHRFSPFISGALITRAFKHTLLNTRAEKSQGLVDSVGISISLFCHLRGGAGHPLSPHVGFISSGCHTRIPQTGGLNNRDVFSWSLEARSLEVHDQGASRVGVPVTPPSVAYRQPSHNLASVHTLLASFFPYKDTGPVRWGCHHCDLIYSWLPSSKALSLNTVLLGGWGISIWIWRGEDTTHSITHLGGNTTCLPWDSPDPFPLLSISSVLRGTDLYALPVPPASGGGQPVGYTGKKWERRRKRLGSQYIFPWPPSVQDQHGLACPRSVLNFY